MNSINKRLIFLLFIVIVALFYWYQYRPAQGRKICADYAVSKTKEHEYNLEEAIKARNALFESCMNQRGLKK